MRGRLPILSPVPALSLLSLLALLAVSAAFPTPAGAAASAWSENPQSKVRLITPYRVAPVGREIHLGLHFELAPEWHVYWKNSGDAGFPPVIDLEATPELGDAELLWPPPERYELPGDLVAFGYGDEVVYPIRARLGDGVADPVEIVLVVDYLVCRIDCIPYRYTLRLEQPVGREPEPDPETAPLLDRWRDRLPLPASEVPGIETRGWLDLSEARRPVLQVTVAGGRADPRAVAASEGGPGRPQLFLESHDLYDAGRPTLEESPDGLRFRVPLDPRRTLDAPPESAAFAWTVTGLAPAGGPAGRAPGVPLAIEARRTVPAGTEDPEPGGRAVDGAGADARGRLPAGLPPATLLARSFVGGLVLALTPAALALLILTLGELRRERAPGARFAAAAAGAVVTAVALGAVDLASGGSGLGGWNVLLQQPLAVTALALVALALALRLWGLAGTPGDPDAAREHALARSFGAGLVLPLLAVAWPVPPAPGAIDGAMATGPGFGLAAAALAAVGLTLPLALPLVPAWKATASRSSSRPRDDGADDAGEEEIAPDRRSPSREALGFLAALSVVWLLYVLSGRVDSEDLAFVELSLLGIGLAGWAGRRAATGGARSVWMLVAAASAGAALWVAAAA